MSRQLLKFTKYGYKSPNLNSWKPS